MPGFFKQLTANFVNSILTGAKGYTLFRDVPVLLASGTLNDGNPSDTLVTVDTTGITHPNTKAVILATRLTISATAVVTYVNLVLEELVAGANPDLVHTFAKEGTAQAVNDWRSGWIRRITAGDTFRYSATRALGTGVGCTYEIHLIGEIL